jgi:excisionase family DNA binding protein
MYQAHRAVYAWFCVLQNKQHREEREMMSSENSGVEKLLTKGEVARLCRVDVRTVDRWLMAGKVGYHRTPSGRVLFRKHDVLEVVACGQNSSLAQRR